MLGRIVNNTYKIEREIGSGGMGSVYLASHLRIKNRKFAVKFLHTELTNNKNFLKRFQREAQILMSLNHPHIVKIEDFLEERDPLEKPVYILVTEFIEGRGLDSILEESPDGLPIQKSVLFVLEILSALDHCWENQIIHRDLKPSNILITDGEEHVKLTDFGISLSMQVNEKLTATGNIIGTPQYMAPEQILNQPLGPYTDIYALGILFYYMVTGAPPFLSDTLVTLLTSQCHQPPPPIKDKKVPTYIKEIISKALEKEPQARFQTPAEMGLVLYRSALEAGTLTPDHDFGWSDLPRRLKKWRDAVELKGSESKLKGSESQRAGVSSEGTAVFRRSAQFSPPSEVSAGEPGAGQAPGGIPTLDEEEGGVAGGKEGGGVGGDSAGGKGLSSKSKRPDDREGRSRGAKMKLIAPVFLSLLAVAIVIFLKKFTGNSGLSGVKVTSSSAGEDDSAAGKAESGEIPPTPREVPLRQNGGDRPKAEPPPAPKVEKKREAPKVDWRESRPKSSGKVARITRKGQRKKKRRSKRSEFLLFLNLIESYPACRKNFKDCVETCKKNFKNEKEDVEYFCAYFCWKLLKEQQKKSKGKYRTICPKLTEG